MPLSAVVAALREAGVAVGPACPGAGRLEGLGVAGVQQDSRRVGAGDLFVAWEGSVADGHDHVAAAAELGAAAAIVERPVANAGIPQIQVDNARLAGAVASSHVMGEPWRALSLVGVTGTNGKTTTALLLRWLLAKRGPAAAIGTLGVVGSEGRVLPGTRGLTTPDAVRLSGWLRELADEGVESVVVESSSHALSQHRLDGVRFEVAAFTNLTRDHLDYHGTRRRYLAAKAHLLELGRDGATAVINADDAAWEALRPPGRVVSYGIDAAAELRAGDVRLGAAGSRFELAWRGRRRLVELPLPGRFNVSNALAAAGCALALGLALDEAAAGLESAPQIPGRMETVAREPFRVIIDFAHTPDALERALSSLRAVAPGRVIVVFGAGGDRDSAKRPAMGAAAARHADLAVVTSDNPRTEDPGKIVAEVARGVAQAGGRAEEIVDRREAIGRALDAAAPGDAVLIAGKGHERVQVVGGERRPFDERRIVREHLAGCSPR